MICSSFLNKLLVILGLFSTGLAVIFIVKYNTSNVLPADSVERLLSLPYLSFCKVDSNEKDLVGITKYIPELCHDGYNSYGSSIISMEGDILKTKIGGLFVLLPDDTIFINRKRRLLKLTLEGKKIWGNNVPIHHEIFLTSQNTILTITKGLPINSNGEKILYNGRRVGFDTILEYDINGTLVDSWSSWDNFSEINKHFKFHHHHRLEQPFEPDENLNINSESIRLKL